MRRTTLVVLSMVFAVAAGIALGAGPLSSARAPEQEPRAQQPAVRPAQPADPRADYADALAAALSPRLYAGDELSGRQVALVRLPGVPDEQLGALVEQVGATGAGVVSQYAVLPSLLDPDNKSLVDTLGSQLAQQLTGTTVPADATAYERIGALLGAVLATQEGKGADPAADGSTIEQSLAGAELVTPVLVASRRAPIVLVVVGEDPGGTADQVLPGLVAGLAGTARSVVVTGPSDAATGDGLLVRLRSEGPLPGVTTVDGIDGPAGRVTAALALVRSFTNPGGDFGASGADGPVPMG